MPAGSRRSLSGSQRVFDARRCRIIVEFLGTRGPCHRHQRHQRGDNTSYPSDKRHRLPPAANWKLCYDCPAKSGVRGTAQGIMKLFVRMLLAPIVSVSLGTCCSAEALRVAVQKTGTFAWELAVIRAHGLDKQANLSVEVIELASPEAGKIALRAGMPTLLSPTGFGSPASAGSGPSSYSTLTQRAWFRDGAGGISDPDLGRSERPEARRCGRPHR